MKKSISIDIKLPADLLQYMAHDPQGWARFCWETYGRYVDNPRHPASKVSVKLSAITK